MTRSPTDPHADAPILRVGPDAAEADVLLLLLHGRGASARSMTPLVDALGEGLDARVAAWLPQATGGAWYPQRFVAPREANQPWLDSALGRVDGLLQEAIDAGVPPDRIVLGGFSQGACLALEAFARGGRRLGAVTAFAGGLIGETLDPDDYAADLGGVPVFIGSADPDPHIPSGRVEASARLLRERGADVDARLYPGLGHTIGEDELAAARDLLRAVAAS